jgi:hypothetical protein
MAKKVEFEGKKYKITYDSYGFDSSRLFVNGEGSGITMYNGDLLKVELFKEYAKRAIIEYIKRLKVRSVFNEWDGKL